MGWIVIVQPISDNRKRFCVIITPSLPPLFIHVLKHVPLAVERDGEGQHKNRQMCGLGEKERIACFYHFLLATCFPLLVACCFPPAAPEVINVFL